jgi:dynactin-4
VAPLKDAWAYDEEDEEEEDLLPGLESSEGVSEEGSSSRGTLGRRSRKSLLMSGSVRDKKRGESGVEKKGNMSKVGLEVEILPATSGPVEVRSEPAAVAYYADVKFDLEVRYTYRAEDVAEKEAAGGEKEKGKKEEYKTFTYWIRVHVGEVA